MTKTKQRQLLYVPLGSMSLTVCPRESQMLQARFKEKCMKDIHLKEVIVFLDDLIVFSNTLEEHERIRTQVFFQNLCPLSRPHCTQGRSKNWPWGCWNIKNLSKTTNLERTPIIPLIYRWLPEVCEGLIVKPLTSPTAGYPPKRNVGKPRLDGFK